jgi:hypothetical protein
VGYKWATIYADVVEHGQGRKAIKIRMGNESWWLPKSQIHTFQRLAARNYRLVIPKWLADQKGIKDYFTG